MWEGPDGQPLHTCCIITMDASPKMMWLHDRMPLLLKDDAAVEAWLVSVLRTSRLHTLSVML